MTVDFRPYVVYKSNLKRIADFRDITELSYGITQQLLFRSPGDTLGKIDTPMPGHDELTYGPASMSVRDVDEVCRWVTMSELADLTGQPERELADAAASGELGPTENHPKTGDLLVIWPEEHRATERADLPEPGKKKYRVTMTVKARAALGLDPTNPDEFEEVQQGYLSLAHSVGDPEEVGERALEVLFEATLLLQWTAFEVFVPSTVHELFRRHPEVLATKRQGRKGEVSLQDAFDMSHRFTDAEALRSSLVARAIEQEEGAERSVHGLINLLKSEFRFTKDPYKSWLVR